MNSPLNFMTLYFSIEVIVAELIFTRKMKKRSFFILRIMLVLPVYFAFALLFPELETDNVYLISTWNLIRFLGFFCTSVCVYYCIFSEKIQTVIVNCAAGYAVQNVCIKTLIFFHYINLKPEGIPLVVYILLTNFLPCLALIGVFFLIFIHYAYYRNVDRRLNGLAFWIVIGCMVFSRVFDFMERGLANDLAQLSMSYITCIPALIIQSSIISQIQKEKDAQIMDRLLRDSSQEYQEWKQSMDLINVKMHDLKKMIHAVENQPQSEEINQIKDAIAVYESAIKTGNDTIDIILFQKEAIARDRQIDFSVMVDGKILSFMKQEDIFALFSNIIDNAFENISQERKSITLDVHQMKCMAIISMENYYDGEIQFFDDLPMTTKDEKTLHGFGMKSVKMIVDKYQGNMEIRAKDGYFSLNIFLPLLKDKMQVTN